MEHIRLNKWLVQVGVCSRREADRLIEYGAVTVNGVRAILGQKIIGNEKIIVRGQIIHPPKSKKSVYIAYNKPIGVICTSDQSAHDNIIDAIDFPERIFHIGRLDVASSGLILLTNNGDIVNTILRSEGRHEKEYLVRIDRALNDEMLTLLREGVPVLGRDTLPARVEQIDHDAFRITIVEGRNRQIRRMCEIVGANVVALKRVRIMHIELDDLPVGRWRYLTTQEEKQLLGI